MSAPANLSWRRPGRRVSITALGTQRVYFGPFRKGERVTRLVVMATDPDADGMAAATQAQEEAGSATDAATTPGRQQYHPSASKGWCEWNATTPAILASYNVSSLTDNGVGDFTVNWSTAFSSADYCGVSVAGDPAGAATTTLTYFPYLSKTAGAVRMAFLKRTDGDFSDMPRCYVVCFGDQ